MKSSEFIKNNPELVERAKKCKTKEDFIILVKKNGIEFEDISLEMAYDFLHAEDGLSEDALESVAGGKGKRKSKDRVIIPELTKLNTNQDLNSALIGLQQGKGK